jgi:hypothetical protein
MADPSGLRRFRAHWAAWHHGTVTDPRNQLVARRAQSTVADVLAVRACLLEHASAAPDRGSVEAFEHDVCDVLLGLPDGRTAAIVEALSERGFVRDGRLADWEITQAVRDAATGVDRKRRQRERQRESRAVTGRHVTSPHRTGQDRTGEERTQEPKSAAPARRVREEPVEFLEIRRLYPRRAGGQRWADALRGCHARLAEGSTWRELVEGARRYAEFCQATGKVGTEVVQQAGTFFGANRGFAEAWDLPKPVRSLKQQAADDAMERFLRATDPPTEDEIRAAREEAIRANERTVQRAGMAGRNGVTIDAGAAVATVVDRLRRSQ